MTSDASSATGSSQLDHDGDSTILDDPLCMPQSASEPALSVAQQHNASAMVDQSTSATRRQNHAQPQRPIKPSGPVCEYGPRLAYTYFSQPVPSQHVLNACQQDVHFFTVDDQLVYLSFYQDSGPLNAACLYRFCLHVHTLLEDAGLRNKRIMLYSSDEPDKKANAALLIALYAMIVLRWTPADVLHPIACLELQPFRDAGYARADFHLSIQSCIYGIHRAIALHLLDLSTFDLVAYETYEKVENGDWNWITPGFVAFASPVEPGYVHSNNGASTSTIGGGSKKIEGAKPRLSTAFTNVLNEFESSNVKVVIRLNKKLYDASHFTERGMEHVEMYFDDGTNPTMEMAREFIDLADKVITGGGAVAVHCKAGLGRTGTLIGAYLIYKHGFSADEAIGFMRLMRPGTCVGPQQHFLYENQMTWVKWGALDVAKAEQRLIATNTSLSTVEALTTSTNNVHQRSVTPTTPARPITPPNETELARHRQTTPAGSHVAPRTPARPGHVPGQPRKTPGKSKHAVATPEIAETTEIDMIEGVDQDETGEVEGEPGVLLEDELMLVAEEEARNGEHMPIVVVPSSPVKVSTRPSPPKQPDFKTNRVVSGGTKRALASPSQSTRPTRIARATGPTMSTAAKQHQQNQLGVTSAGQKTTNSRRHAPLSAIADNRIVDRLGVNSGAAASGSAGHARAATRATTRQAASATATPKNTRDGSNAEKDSDSVRRSKAVRDLGTLFDRQQDEDELAAGAGVSGYNLRRGTNKSSPTATTPPASDEDEGTTRTDKRLGSAFGTTSRAPAPPASPSKLPTRIASGLGTRRGGAKVSVDAKRERSITSTGAATTTTVKTVPVSATVGLRNTTRRRRSSLGSTDFV
ncbi:cell division control protein 14 [Microbotryomycetes sp. JL221]|nr:cell division control protein 14 [Microbotryomycetes sp. JL221]